MAGEIQKWRCLPVLLPHEQQRHEGREQIRSGSELQAFKIDQESEAFSKSAIADLIVILRADYIVCTLERRRAISVASPPMARILTSVIPALLQRLRQMLNAAEILVVSRIFTGQQRMHGMMEIVAPLRWHAQSAFATRTQHARIVQIALRDQRNDSPGLAGESVNFLRQFCEKRKRARIKDSVKGVEPQHIDMKSFQPVKRVFDEKAAYVVAVGSVKVQRRSPRRLVMLGKIWTIFAQIIAFRSEVVVDDVQCHGEAPRMRGIHQQLQIARSSVTVLDGKGIHAVIAPIPRARKLRDRHYLDSGYTKSGKTIEYGAQGIEGSFICEGPHVQFVEHAVRQL